MPSRRGEDPTCESVTGELPLTGRERLVLALGVDIACAVIALAERHPIPQQRPKGRATPVTTEESRMSTARREEAHDFNLVDLLLFEHRRQRALLAELQGGSGEPGAVAFRRLARMLATHEAAEEIVLYPVVRANFDGGDRLARLATEQEVTVKRALSKLQSGGLARDQPSSASRRTGLQQVEERLQAHHEFEERQILAALPEFEDAAALGGLASAYKIATHFTPTRGHRRGPTGAMSNVLLGAPLGMLDRLRGLRYRDPDT